MNNDKEALEIFWKKEYYKLKAMISLWDYYEKLARADELLPKYPEIAQDAMDAIREIDPENKSKARPES